MAGPRRAAVAAPEVDWTEIVRLSLLGLVVAFLVARLLSARCSYQMRRLARWIFPGRDAKLPVDVFHLVCSELARRGDRPSLLSLMRTSRHAFSLGMPFLMRELDLLRVDDVWKLESLLEGGRDRWRHVRTVRAALSAGERSERFFSALRILSRCAPYAETVALWLHGGVAPEIWKLLPSLAKCRFLEVRLSSHGPLPGDDHFAWDMPEGRSRASRPGPSCELPPNLEHLAVSNPEWLPPNPSDPSDPASSLRSLTALLVPRNIPWSFSGPRPPEPADLPPGTLALLSHLSACHANDLPPSLPSDPRFRPRSMRLFCAAVPGIPVDPAAWAALLRLPLGRLRLEDLRCSVDAFPALAAHGTLERLVLWRPVLRGARRGAVRRGVEALRAKGCEVVVVPGRGVKEARWWRGLEGVQVVEEGDGGCVVGTEGRWASWGQG
ncbi:hypothetical protein DFJ74DRAFT_772957 [Hyaloraphidium curvatum]|nr:hypothetical protein DFJ74DRAFT_772957 [Hyaloraphidium curvatum]